MLARVLFLNVLTACNQWYGIAPTYLHDAPPDAVGCSARPFMFAMTLPDPTPQLEQNPTLAADNLELYFSMRTAAGTTRLHRATRGSGDAPFGDVTEMPWLPDRATHDAALTRDSLTLMFVSRAADNLVLEVSRSSIGDAFGAPTLVSGLGNISGGVQTIDLSYDGRTLYYANIAGDLWTASRSDVGAPFENPRVLFNAATFPVVGPSVSPDGRELFYNDPADSDADDRIYRVVRASAADDFDPGTEMVVQEQAVGADIAQDGATFVLSSLGMLAVLTRQCP